MSLAYSLKSKINKKIRNLKNSCLILCYHRVGKEINDLWGNCVSVENFNFHVQHLSEKYNILSMDQLFDQIQNGKLLNRRNIVITFDDGYKINTNYAMDILDRYKVPSTFYMNTYNLNEDKFFWWDELQLIFSEKNALPSRLIINVYGSETIFNLDNKENITFAIRTLHGILKGQKPDIRRTILLKIADQIKCSINHSSELLCVKDLDILKTANNKLFSIGGHTHSHNSLSLLDYNSQNNEIKINKEILEKIIKMNIKHFSFPFGARSDYNNKSLDIIKSLEYCTAVTTQKSPFRIDGGIYEIPRFSIKNWDSDLFSHKIKNYFNF
jgi:peptidoglycan/xylan/chitin deacetylase (PgdA/CDA1 family)